MIRLDGRRVVVVGPEGPARTAVEEALAAAGAQPGELDGSAVALVVHLTALGGEARPLVEVDEAAWEEAAEAPARALLATLQAAHAGLRAGGGRLVVVVPATSLEGAAGLVAETTGWGAVRLLAKSAARRWAADGIAVTVVAPRLETPPDAARSAPVLGPEHHGHRALAETVLLLAADEAAHLTGATLQVDGGALMLP